MEKWYCAVFERNSDRMVERDLAHMGHRAFVPRLRKWISHARRRQAVERPFLGRYFFVEVDWPRQSFSSLATARGLDSVLSLNGEPVEIPTDQVAAWMRRYLEGEWDAVRNTGIPLMARVAIVEGQFNAMIGTVTRIKRKIATVKLDDQDKPVQIPEFSLRPA